MMCPKLLKFLKSSFINQLSVVLAILEAIQI
jgi:hypothetical protein